MTAAIYARKSTDDNVADEQKSTARQVDHARAYAARKGWTVDAGHVFEDDGISGAEFAKRPGYLRLMNALGKRAPFRVLIVSELSRLGREQFETNFTLKQLSEAGVRIFSYLEDREIILDSAIDRFLLAAVNFGAELEREKASLRSHDKARQLVQAGHVAGGVVFGYDNVKVTDAQGRHSHVERRINEVQAAVVRRIFELRAQGVGQARIAKRLNAEGAGAPGPRGAGRARGWAASTVREILFRELYRGRVVWNRKRKRTPWGREQHSARPAADWLALDAPDLRIVPDDLWTAAHRRLAEARSEYDRVTGGRRRPTRDRDSKYLLVGFAACGVCGGGLHVRTRSTKRGRAYFYACTNHYAKQACPSHDVWPLAAVDQAVLTTIAGDVLDPTLFEAAMREARRQFEARQSADPSVALRAELQALEAEQARLADAIAAGGHIPALLARLDDTERRRRAVVSQLERCPSAARGRAQGPSWRDIEGSVRAALMDWRTTLLASVADARDAFRQLLAGKVSFTPIETERGKGLQFEGRIGLQALFGGEVTSGMTRAGIEPATL